MSERNKHLTPEQRASLIERLRLKASQYDRHLEQALPIPLISRELPPPLSFSQERLWLFQQLNPTDVSYNITQAVSFQGSIHLGTLQKSIQEIIRRHEILRTTIRLVNEQPRQVITPRLTLAIPLIDLQELSTTEQEQYCQHLIAEEGEQLFDLERGPLIRFFFVRLGPQNHLLLFSIHHIIFDGWSIGVFVRELVALYEAFRQHQPSPLAPLALQYADFASWQREQLHEQRLQQLLAYWQAHVAHVPALLELPTDRPRTANRTYRGAKKVFIYSEELQNQLKVLSQREGTTLFMTLLAAFKVLLYRNTQERTICVGVPVANRGRVELWGLLGLFINNLPLCTHIQSGQPFNELLQRVRKVCLDGFMHQELPFEQLIRSLQIERNTSYTPLFQILFSMRNTMIPDLEVPGLHISALEIQREVTKYDLTMEVEESQTGLICRLVYSTDLFDESTITRLLNQFHCLLQSIVTHPEQSVDQLALLSDEERSTLVTTWNRTDVVLSPVCVHELFESQAASRPDAIALRCAGEHLTYGQLNIWSDRLASYLQHRGVGPEVPVGLCMETSLEQIIALLGILKAGGAYVPIDPRHPRPRIAHLLNNVAPALILTQQRLQNVLPYDAERIFTAEEWHNLQDQAYIRRGYGALSATLAYILSTSGSTGVPKEIMLTHQGLTNYLQWAISAYKVGATCDSLLHSPLTFDLTITSLFLPLITGGSLELLSAEETITALGRALDQAPVINLLKITPSHLKQLNTLLPITHNKTDPIVLILGGEALHWHDVQNWRIHCPTTRLINEYGPTETVVGCCVFEATSAEQGAVPIGRPIANTQLYILSSMLEPVPIGAIGELYIGGHGLARGYLNRADLTAERFLPNPFSSEPGARLYRTGDLARYRPDGTIEYHGRTDNQVKVRGFRIELGEIEAVLCDHPQVNEASVLLTRNRAGELMLTAYISVRQPGSVTEHALRRFLQARLPEYMVPAAFLILDALPLTPHGKVDRSALAAVARPPAQETHPQETLTPIEELIIMIWCEVLGIDRIAVNENFFALGGHSLRAVQAMSRLSIVLNQELPVRLLFEAPTVKELASQISSAQAVVSGQSIQPISAIAHDSPFLPSFAQERLWLMQQLDPMNPFYNTITVVRLRGPLDLVSLQRSLNAIIERHEVLRSTFQFRDGHLVVRINPATSKLLQVLDLTSLSESAQDNELQRLLRHCVHEPFDLAEEPLIRVHLVRRHRADHTLALTIHHIVIDGWSMDVLHRELAALYAAFANAQPASLPPLPIQYADYAHWQRTWLQGEVLGTQLAYWKKQLHALPPLLSLPTDYPRPAVQHFQGARQMLLLPSDIVTALKQFGKQQGVTLFMALLAVFQALLARYSGQQDIVVGTPVAHRQRPELEDLIGFFANTLVLRTDVAGELSFIQLVQRVRKVCLDAYTHQDLPFEKLVEELQPARNTSYSPLFQVMFTFQTMSSTTHCMQDLTLEPVWAPVYTAKFDLLMAVRETDEGLLLLLEYNGDLFQEATITRMLKHFQILLEAFLAKPERPIQEASLLTVDEQEQALSQWTAPHTPLAPGIDVAGLFEAVAIHAPHEVALVCEKESLSYEELNQRSNQLAHELRALGVAAEVPVILYLERSCDFVVGIMGILKASGVYIPLEADIPTARVMQIIHDAGARIVVTRRELIADLTLDDLNILFLDWHIAPLRGRPVTNPIRQVDPDHLAYCIYTSGSTGKPKGVAVAHKQLLNYLHGIMSYLNPAERSHFGLISTFAADLGHTMLFPALCTGGCLHIISRARMLDPELLITYCQQHPLDYLKIVPSHLLAMIDHPRASEMLPRQWLILGGEALPWELVDRLQTLHPTCRILNHYGPTETTVGVLVSEIRAEPHERQTRLAPLQQPLANTQVYVLDSALHPLPAGLPGELYIGGEGVSRGYLNAPAATAERFLPCPFSEVPGARLYRTGDRVRATSTGQIEFLGRTDEQIKVRGFRVELQEIEAALRQHPAVQQALVLSEYANNDTIIRAYVVTHPRFSPTFRGQRRYTLPNGLAILHLNKNETDYLYKEIFEVQAYLRYGITIKPGDLVIDVGGNIGLFSLFAHLAASNVKLLVFEPNPSVFAILQANTALYNVDAKLFNIGLAEQERIADLVSFTGYSIFSGFYTDPASEKQLVKAFMQNMEQAGATDMQILRQEADQILEQRFESHSQPAQLRPLSSILEEEQITHVDLLKVNVEKSELAVLRGIKDVHWSLIKQVVLEVDLEKNLGPILALLEQHGFSSITVQEPLLEGTQLFYVYAARPTSGRHLYQEEPGGPIRISPGDAQLLSPEQLHSYISGILPSYMLPASYTLLEALPLTPNGKPDRQALRALHASERCTSAPHLPPSTELERQIAAIWQEVLGRDPIGLDDNFFDLGGHSLLIVQAYQKLNQIYHERLHVIDLFKYTTVRALADFLSSQRATHQAVPPPTRAEERGAAIRRQAQLRRAHRTRRGAVTAEPPDSEEQRTDSLESHEGSKECPSRKE